MNEPSFEKSQPCGRSNKYVIDDRAEVSNCELFCLVRNVRVSPECVKANVKRTQMPQVLCKLLTLYHQIFVVAHNHDQQSRDLVIVLWYVYTCSSHVRLGACQGTRTAARRGPYMVTCHARTHFLFTLRAKSVSAFKSPLEKTTVAIS